MLTRATLPARRIKVAGIRLNKDKRRALVDRIAAAMSRSEPTAFSLEGELRHRLQLPMSARRRLDPRRSAGRGHCRGCPAEGRSAAPDLAAGSARMDAGGGDLHSAHAVHPVQMEIAAGPSEILLAALRPSASSRAGAPLQRCRWESLRLCASMTSPTMLAPGAAPRSRAIRSALCCASTAAGNAAWRPITRWKLEKRRVGKEGVR